MTHAITAPTSDPHVDDARRFTESATARDGIRTPNPQFRTWLAEVRRKRTYRVTTVPLERLDGWSADPGTGDLTHRSGRFHTIGGLAVATPNASTASWSQPIILQPEFGILGILVKEFDGVLHCLMQAKMEPGNVNLIQLSPTVQATRSNYTRAHRGAAPPYLDYFDSGRASRVLVDTLQSEQGAWFLQKRNRNMVVEASGDVPAADGFCWLTLGQLNGLLKHDNLVNMDARSVMAAIPYAVPGGGLAQDGSFRAALLRSLHFREASPGVHSPLGTWFIDAKSRHSITRERIPLNRVEGWSRTPERISREDGRFFSVIGVDVEASEREVPRWSQPLFAPAAQGVLALLARRFGGVAHFLVQARTEAGTFDTVEMAPTVQCTPVNYPDGALPPFLDYALSAPEERRLFDAVHSEEGGRFYHAENRYMIIDTGEDLPEEPPDGYAWATAGRLSELARHSHYLNVELRCLLTCMQNLW